MADVVAHLTGQEIQLLGMMTEAMHNPFLMDRFVALKSAEYVRRAWSSMGGEVMLRPGGLVQRRADETLGRALALLEEVARDGLMASIARARFGDVARAEDGGKGLAGVVERAPGYFNPLVELLEAQASAEDPDGDDDGDLDPARALGTGVEGLAL
jgi:beta-lysine 5,6-aminomutase alpha subunit